MRNNVQQLAAERRIVLKQEPSSVVELLGTGPATVVRKTYTNRGVRRLQSFGRRSRAQREFENLRELEARGIRCPKPVEWSARQRFGCVESSVIVTRFIPGCDTLKGVLGGLLSWRSLRERQRLATAAGAQLRTLHARGFIWCSPMPRNVLVVVDLLRNAPPHALLAVCDAPRGFTVRRPQAGGRIALIDLFDAAFSPSRRRDWSRAERYRFLLGYCSGDRQEAQRLWRALTARPVWQHELTRSLAMLWHNYLLRPIRSAWPRRSTRRGQRSPHGVG